MTGEFGCAQLTQEKTTAKQGEFKVKKWWWNSKTQLSQFRADKVKKGLGDGAQFVEFLFFHLYFDKLV